MKFPTPEQVIWVFKNYWLFLFVVSVLHSVITTTIRHKLQKQDSGED